ncbi:MAG: MFS transporter [Myxococcales bacterium]|nr:MFS transporter [Myxococcales bacterium]
MPRGVIALGLVSLFMDVSSELIHSVLPLFLTSLLGVSALWVGIVEGIAESTAAIVKIFSGAISDFIGKRKPLLLLGYGLALLTRPLFPLSQGFGTILFARFVDRIGKGIRVAPRDALLADITPKEIRGAAYGLRQSMDTVGAFLGPILAMLIMLGSHNNFRLVFWLALLPALLVVLIIWLAIDEPAPKADPVRRPFPLRRDQLSRLSPAFWSVTVLSSFLTLARFSDAFLILRGDSIHLPAAYAPTILIVMNAVYALAAWPAGILSDRIGKRRLLTLGIAVLIVADLLLAWGDSIPSVFLGASLWGLHMGLSQGILTALIADEAPAELRGTAFGMYNLLSGGALLLASVIAGYLWKQHGPLLTFSAGAAFSTIALVGFLLRGNRSSLPRS